MSPVFEADPRVALPHTSDLGSTIDTGTPPVDIEAIDRAIYRKFETEDYKNKSKSNLLTVISPYMLQELRVEAPNALHILMHAHLDPKLSCDTAPVSLFEPATIPFHAAIPLGTPTLQAPLFFRPTAGGALAVYPPIFREAPSTSTPFLKNWLMKLAI